MDANLPIIRLCLKLVMGWNARSASAGLSGGIALHGILATLKHPDIHIFGIEVALARVEMQHCIAFGLFVAAIISLLLRRRVSKELLDRISAIKMLRVDRAITSSQANDLFLALARSYTNRSWEPDQVPRDASSTELTSNGEP